MSSSVTRARTRRSWGLKNGCARCFWTCLLTVRPGPGDCRHLYTGRWKFIACRFSSFPFAAYYEMPPAYAKIYLRSQPPHISFAAARRHILNGVYLFFVNTKMQSRTVVIQPTRYSERRVCVCVRDRMERARRKIELAKQRTRRRRMCAGVHNVSYTHTRF